MLNFLKAQQETTAGFTENNVQNKQNLSLRKNLKLIFYDMQRFLL